MRRLVLTCALCLAACDKPAVAPTVPPELLREVVVRCPDGATERAVGECLMRKSAGLDEANSKLASVARILSGR